MCEDNDDMVYLKYNTIPIRVSTATAVMINLQELLKNMPIAFYELVMLCRDSEHAIFNEVLKLELIGRALLREDGSVDCTIKEVVLSAVIGDGSEMRLVSPISL